MEKKGECLYQHACVKKEEKEYWKEKDVNGEGRDKVWVDRKMPKEPSDVWTEEEEKNEENDYVCGETYKTKKVPHARRDNFLVTQKKKKEKKKKKGKPTKIKSLLFITQPHSLHRVTIN